MSIVFANVEATEPASQDTYEIDGLVHYLRRSTSDNTESNLELTKLSSLSRELIFNTYLSTFDGQIVNINNIGKINLVIADFFALAAQGIKEDKKLIDLLNQYTQDSPSKKVHLLLLATFLSDQLFAWQGREKLKGILHLSEATLSDVELDDLLDSVINTVHELQVSYAEILPDKHDDVSMVNFNNRSQRALALNDAWVISSILATSSTHLSEYEDLFHSCALRLAEYVKLFRDNLDHFIFPNTPADYVLITSTFTNLMYYESIRPLKGIETKFLVLDMLDRILSRVRTLKFHHKALSNLMNTLNNYIVYNYHALAKQIQTQENQRKKEDKPLFDGREADFVDGQRRMQDRMEELIEAYICAHRMTKTDYLPTLSPLILQLERELNAEGEISGEAVGFAVKLNIPEWSRYSWAGAFDRVLAKLEA